MTSDSHLRYSPYWNALPVDPINNKLANIPLKAPIKNNSFPTSTFWSFSYGFTPSSIFDILPTSVPTPSFTPIIAKYINEDL